MNTHDQNIDTFLAAVDNAYAKAKAAHDEGRCGESDYSCSYCEGSL